ncbi:MAG: class I SAM-dependent methyltransferase [Candidatus Wildermuthbacteria bacterium]|nr:class I SAM-dependent methyltransferase [Candidatus Wildermuthbacteria bacterium]
MNQYNKQWAKEIKKNDVMYPSEYVIRIFKGTYPRLRLGKNRFKGKKICDIGCGNGRNLMLLRRCGFKVWGVEINKKIAEGVKRNLKSAGIHAHVRVGSNGSLPFLNSYFDYALSWNACYYMGDCADFNDYVKEFARVIKSGGYLIMSIPKKSSFIYKGSETLKAGYKIIRKDPFGVRNGHVLRMFAGEKEIKKTFAPYFKRFVFGSVQDDCFGLNYHWHLVVCQRR